MIKIVEDDSWMSARTCHFNDHKREMAEYQKIWNWKPDVQVKGKDPKNYALFAGEGQD